MIHFTVPAVPIAQPRPRAVVRASGRAGVFGAKASHPVHAFKAACAFAARQAYAGAPLEGPLEISLAFVFPRPANRCWKTRPMPREWHTKKPDSDNCAKSVLDCLCGVIFRDDAQVCVKRVAKLIAAGDEQPHVEVFIRERPAPPASIWRDDVRICTCLGTCRGEQGLGTGWVCALTEQPEETCRVCPVCGMPLAENQSVCSEDCYESMLNGQERSGGI